MKGKSLIRLKKYFFLSLILDLIIEYFPSRNFLAFQNINFSVREEVLLDLAAGSTTIEPKRKTQSFL